MNKRHLILDISGVLILSDRWGKTRTNQELIDYLLAKKDNFSYTILTNNAPETERHLEAVYKIPKFYEHFISAGAYNLPKSDPKLYEEVLAKLLAMPEQCVFIDDTQPNVEAAASLGITGLLYKNFSEFKREIESL